MVYDKEYVDDLLVRLAHNSSAIEGNTISLPETADIILNGKMPSSNKDVREFYEIDNHKYALEYILDLIEEGKDLDIYEIKEIHKLLTHRLQHDAGEFKSAGNMILGANFETVPAENVYEAIKDWLDNSKYSIENSDDKLKAIAYSHIKFERIHPFSDGNGRTGRMVILFLSIRYLGYPALIYKEDKAQYVNHLSEQDDEALGKLLQKSFDFESNRYKNIKEK